MTRYSTKMRVVFLCALCLSIFASQTSVVAQPEAEYFVTTVSPDGTKVLGIRTDDRVIVYDSSTGLEIFEVEQTGPVPYIAAWSPDSNRIAVSSPDLVRVSCADTRTSASCVAGELLTTIDPEKELIQYLDWGSNDVLIVASQTSGGAGLTAWDMSDYSFLNQHPANTFDQIKFNPDATKIAIAIGIEGLFVVPGDRNYSGRVSQGSCDDLSEHLWTFMAQITI